MAHDHHHHHHDKQENIKIAFLLNISFAILEIIGGLLTNSMAILSDALHDLGDSISLGGAWYLERYADKGPDSKFSFGYARFSLLAALINSLILVTGSILILIRAIPRLFNPEVIDPKGMLVFAIIGIFINGLAVLRLKGGSSFNEKIVSWHLLEDVLGWLVILIASVVLMFVDLWILDPILSILLTIYVVINVMKNLKEIVVILLQGVPSNIDINQIETMIKEKTDVECVYHTHVWSLEGEKILLSTHLVVNDNISRDQIIKIKNDVKELMLKKGIEHVTVQIDFDKEDKENFDCCNK